MKKFKMRKKLLALLVSGNILLTGCSITGNITSKNEESIEESSYKQSSKIDPSIEESSKEKSSQVEASKEETSIEESSEVSEESKEEIVEETSIEEEPSIEEISEEPSIEESYELENNIEEPEEVLTDDSNYIRALYTVNIRLEPNTESTILSTLYEGNVIKKLGYVGNWYIVEYEGNKAYVSKDYTEEIEHSKVDLNESNICYFPYGTTLYSDSELTDKIMDIPSLESAQILNQEDNALYVETEGYNGYVDSISASVIPQPAIIVDKSDQTLSLYKNNQKQMEFSVVTGNENLNFYHPTGEGLFNIYSKSYNAELVGDTWDVMVNVFMGFNGGEGIHDATWRSYFGGDIYTYDGSHGCINCPYNEVMALANEVEVGDKVLVKR